jgi:hypothetical protein
MLIENKMEVVQGMAVVILSICVCILISDIENGYFNKK